VPRFLLVHRLGVVKHGIIVPASGQWPRWLDGVAQARECTFASRTCQMELPVFLTPLVFLQGSRLDRWETVLSDQGVNILLAVAYTICACTTINRCSRQTLLTVCALRVWARAGCCLCFQYGAHIAIDQHYTDLRRFITPIGRGCGLCLDFNCALLLVPMCRALLTALRSTRCVGAASCRVMLCVHVYVSEGCMRSDDVGAHWMYVARVTQHVTCLSFRLFHRDAQGRLHDDLRVHCDPWWWPRRELYPVRVGALFIALTLQT